MSPNPTTHLSRRLRRLARVLVFGGVAAVGFGTMADAAPAGVKAQVKKNVLAVTGTSGTDVIRLRLKPGDATRLEVDVGGNGTADFTFSRSQFAIIEVLGSGGTDTIVADHVNGAFTDTEQTTFDGGAGDDTLTGSVGSERLLGGAGNDIVDGNTGADTVTLGDGNDTFVWDPGDASDTVTGGAGNDTMLFNGANIGETFDVAANGGTVRLTRNIGNVVIDLDDLEAIRLNAMGGADLINVGDLSGTDLATLEPDLAIAGGTDDTQADSVNVPIKAIVGRDGGTPVVNGLGAQVRVANPFPLDEIHLTGQSASDTITIGGTDGADAIVASAAGTDVVIDGATPGMIVRLIGIETTDIALNAGSDTFNAVGNLAALTTLRVDGGNDGDTLFGGNGNDLLDGGQGDDFVDGNQGTDTIVLNDGNDTFQWDPGDSNDTVDGGVGSDTMVFNGSAIGELIGVSNNGGLAHFTRNIAAIAMDLDAVEAINVNTLSGNDVVTVSDLGGTDVTTVTANLAGSGGVDDAIGDTIEVPLGVSIGRDGSTPVVDGLGAQVRVANPFPLDEIHVTGPTASDTITIGGTDGADAIVASAAGTDVVIDGATPGMIVRLTGIETTDIALNAGSDTFNAVGNLAALTTLRVDGGNDGDTLFGGNGNDLLDGGPGNDFVDGNQGTDTIVLNDGNDTFQWDPGDSSDTVDGGTGVDTMVFNGSAIGEIFELSNNGGHARLARNIGNVVIDLDNVENLNLSSFAGNDQVIVNSLVGTDVTGVIANLALIGGSVDATADAVTVDGTSGDDTITIAPDGASVVTTGVGPIVRVTGADATLDSLSIDGSGGSDTIDPVPGVESLIVLTF